MRNPWNNKSNLKSKYCLEGISEEFFGMKGLLLMDTITETNNRHQLLNVWQVARINNKSYLNNKKE